MCVRTLTSAVSSFNLCKEGGHVDTGDEIVVSASRSPHICRLSYFHFGFTIQTVIWLSVEVWGYNYAYLRLPDSAICAARI